MLNPDRVYMLAVDHRWQWEEFCDKRALPRERIPEVKRLAFDGFLLARTRSAAVRDFGALLIDALGAAGGRAHPGRHSRGKSGRNPAGLGLRTVLGVAHWRVRQGARALPPGR